jgi:hypothetical protein
VERAGGVPHGAVDGLARSARAAGLDVVAADGIFGIIDPELGFDLHASTLSAARERAVASDVITVLSRPDPAQAGSGLKGPGSPASRNGQGPGDGRRLRPWARHIGAGDMG